MKTFRPPNNASVMETCSYPYLQPLPPQSSYPTSKQHLKPPISAPKSQFHYARLTSLTAVAALKTPKGFGPPAKRKTKKPTKKDSIDENDYKDDEEEDDDEEEENVIPEIVTNRMMNRIAFSVGTPLFIGLLFFPFFYYLKTGLKIDVPTWIPLLVSFAFFGTALLGVSYGIVSASWDPLREGSLLGWNEAQKNWPVFWQSFRGGSKKK